MINAGILAASGGAIPSGEAVFTTYTYNGYWTAPAGVTSVCVVLIGAGGAAVQGTNIDRSGGGGGALVYKNNIPVTPGTVYGYYLHSDGSSMFGLSAGAGDPAVLQTNVPSNGGVASSAGSPNGFYNGGKGEVLTGPTTREAMGGSTGTYTMAGPDGGMNGQTLYGAYAGSTYYGYGGGCSYSGTPTPAGPGGIRIVWGVGKSFPYNAHN